MHEAILYDKLDENITVCRLCAHRCSIKAGSRGICGVRENIDGILYTRVYEMLIAENVDPIEKKPLFHVYPGSKSYSIAAMGCNFRCSFCQNHDISQAPRETGSIFGRKTSPLSVVESAIRSGSKTISYTYTEPAVYFEYAYDVAKIALEKGLKNVFVSNGFMTEETIDTIAPFLAAANVDLKSFSDRFYREKCGGRLKPVLDSLKRLKSLGVWIEITTLLIPTWNDTDDELRQIAEFICSLGADTPWHVSRFYPRYRVQELSPTSISSIDRAAAIGMASGLKYVYSGNIPGDRGESTFCFNCGEILIERHGFYIKRITLKGSHCPRCAAMLEGIF